LARPNPPGRPKVCPAYPRPTSPSPGESPPRFTEQAHYQLLRDARNEPAGPILRRRRDPSWQYAQRQRDLLIRAETLAVVADLEGHGLTAVQAAALVGVPARTLRQGRQELSQGTVGVKVPGRPAYHGAIEAAMGSLKTRTGFQAYRRGHPGTWTSADLDAARDLANTSARPRGPHGPTPAEDWEARRPPTPSAHAAFGGLVREQEILLRSQDPIALDAVLDHYEQAALHRRVLTQALVDSGLLTIERRRIPQRFFGQKAAKIR
jgi:hypothetical protein